MKIFKIFLTFCTPIFLGLCLGIAVEPPIGPCECAVFGSLETQATNVPIIKQHPMNVTCNKDGQETCLKLCTALAQAAQVRGPDLLCATQQHVNGLMAYVFSRSCDVEAWTFTNISSTEPICCHGGEPVPCKIKE